MMDYLPIRLTRMMCFWCITSFLVFFGFSSFAQAGDDGKLLPATICETWNPTGVHATATYDNTGTVSNRDPDNWLILYCPLLRDERSSSGRLKYVTVYFYNPVTEERIWANINTVTEFGILLDQKNGYGNNDKQSFGIKLSPGIVESHAGNYLLTIVLPPMNVNGEYPSISKIYLVETH